MPCGMACPYDYTTWEINFGAAYGGAWDPGQQAGNRTRAAQAASLMLDLGPGVGDVKGLIEVGTGRDLVSGEALGAWRWVGLLGLVGLAEARDLRHADEAADALRAGKEVAQEVVEVASRSGRPPIVIGENMAERVIPYAQQIGAQTINDFIPAERWSMEANEAWIRQMRAEGREITDIGPDFDRRLYRATHGIRPDSEAYNLERRVLQEYEGYRKVFQRSGKYWGGVPGLDWR